MPKSINIPKLPAMMTRAKSLAVFPGTLGDFVCFLPALRVLAEAGSVDLIARSEYSDLVPSSIRVYSLERREVWGLFIAGNSRDEELEEFFGSYSAVYSWFGFHEPELIHNLQELTTGRLKAFPFGPSSPMHRVDYYLSCLGRDYSPETCPTIGLQPLAVSWADRFWRQEQFENTRVLLISPGSGGGQKNWPTQYFGTIARWWEESLGGKVVILVGPAEAEKSLVLDGEPSRIVIRDISLAQAAALLSKCDVYLGNDSGISHLAAALGAKTFVLFGPTDPLQWLPRGPRVTVIRRGEDCSPCTESLMKSCPHRRCLNELSPDVVADVLEPSGRSFPNPIL